MIKKLIPIVVILVLAGSSVRAQLDRMIFHAGFSYEFVRLHDVVTFPFYGLTGGMNYVIVHSNDQFSLGINPNINAALSFMQGGTSILGQAPVYLVGRYGAGATKYNEQRFGFGAGVGGTYTYIYYDNGRDPEFSQGFLTPVAVVELAIRGRGSVYRVRGHWAFISSKATWGVYEFDISNFGLDVTYTF